MRVWLWFQLLHLECKGLFNLWTKLGWIRASSKRISPILQCHITCTDRKWWRCHRPKSRICWPRLCFGWANLNATMYFIFCDNNVFQSVFQRNWDVPGLYAPNCRGLPAQRTQCWPRATHHLLAAALPYHPSVLVTPVPATSPSVQAASTLLQSARPAVSQETAVMSLNARKVICIEPRAHVCTRAQTHTHTSQSVFIGPPLGIAMAQLVWDSTPSRKQFFF